VRLTLTKSKPGPKGYKDRATRQRGAGLVTRRETRKWENAPASTLRSVRAGWRLAWKHAGRYMKYKNIPRHFREGNIHGGQLWANRNECKMTNKMAGEVLERVYLSGKVSLAQLKQVRHWLSYSYYLMTGNSEGNWPEVGLQWDSFKLANLPTIRKSLVAVKIPVPANLKTAYTKPWTPAHPMSLVDFETAALGAHDYFIFGLRPRVDLDKVKKSTEHLINNNERYGLTVMNGGRSKLQGNKRGTRPWKVHRVCFCRRGAHTSPPKVIRLNQDGNPTRQPSWNTVCPLAIMEFMQNLQGTTKWKPYAKWNGSGTVSRQNHGDVPELANRWLQTQTHQGPFDPNSGRKTLSRWLEELKIPYEVGFEIHGDLQTVWRYSYQPGLAKSQFQDREQSRDIDKATKALRLFAKWLHDDTTKPSLKEQLQGILQNLD